MSKMSKDPALADMQERLFILATVALPLIAEKVDILNSDELDLIHDCILDLAGIALKLDEIEAPEEALALE